MSLELFTKQHRATITTTILMARRTRFVLVESRAEVTVLKPHVCGRAQIHDLNGRPKVEEAWRSLHDNRAANFLALIDADFDEVVGRNPRAPRLLYVALHERRSETTIDLEAMLIRSPSLQAICEDYLGNKLCELGGPVRFANTMRQSLRAAAAAVGSFRAAVMSVFDERRSIQGVGPFEREEWAAMIDLENGSIDQQELERAINRRVMNISKFAEVKQRASDFRLSDGNGWLLCRGHDMTEMLALRLSHICGRPIMRRQVEESLYASHSGNLLTDTAFGAAIHEFCETDLSHSQSPAAIA